NSVATLRDNVIVNTKGPGIMVYGAEDPSRINIIERNFVAGSRESSGIVVGGGPVMVRNNVVVGNSEGGVGLEDYGRRGLLRRIVVTHNTVYDNQRGGILIPSDARVEAEISRNAVAAREGTTAFPVARDGIKLVSNQDCSYKACFVNPENKDFTPVEGSPLRGVRESDDKRPIPVDDYFGRTRGIVPAVGAIEPPGGPIRLGIKP
ncbi:MAG TPA: right-handed parallel beta-helix repeat-containing protein, partial [Methylomirabilota bacterium]|nr:right-handed parallel beta-helix repeat-containing protein [Methylomirabilota bacterium]